MSSRRNFSALAACEALERATSTFVVTVFNPCWALFSWSRRERIRESSLVEGVRLSTVEEELLVVSYETGQASEPTDEPCKRGSRSQIVIYNQDATKHRISQKKVARAEGSFTIGKVHKSTTNTK
jgi:hypothetical protein